MGLRLRLGDATDAEAVAAVHEAAARVAYAGIFPPDRPFPREATLQRWRTFAGRVVVAEDASRVIGFVAFDKRELHALYALYVLPAYWGRAVGGRLLAAAGPVRELWVLRDNARARRFYERHGWRPDEAEAAPTGAVELRYRRSES